MTNRIIFITFMVSIGTVGVGILACGGHDQSVMPTENVRVDLLEQCDADDAKGCYELGVRYLKTDKVTHRRAKQAFKKSCMLKYAEACVELALLDTDVRTHTSFMDPHGAQLALFKQGCSLGSPRACHLLAKTMFYTASERLEMLASHRLLSEACQAGWIEACFDGLRAGLLLRELPAEHLVRTLKRHCASKPEQHHDSCAHDAMAHMLCLYAFGNAKAQI